MLVASFKNLDEKDVDLLLNSEIIDLMSNDFQSQEEIRTFYNEGPYFETAKTIEHYLDLHKSRFQNYRIKHLLQLYTPTGDEKILDVGCALGTLSFALAPYAKEVVGLDYSQTAIQHAERLKKTSPFNNVTFQLGSADNTGLPSEEFDYIVSADLLEHLYPEVSWKMLDECHRLLKKNGKLALWTPHKGHLFEILKNNNIILKKDVSHVDYKNMNTLLKKLEQRNFTIRKAFYAESHIPFFNIFERIFLRFVPVLRRRICILAEKQ